MKEIRVKGTDRPALVDDEDYPMLSRFNWRLLESTGYIMTSINNSGVQMNRFIFGSQAKQYWLVIYKDGDRFNNQKSNLEFWRHSDYFRAKRKQRTTSSRYMGVFYHKLMHKWCVKRRVNGQYLITEYFTDETEAAKRYIEITAQHGKSYSLEGLMARKRKPVSYNPMLTANDVVVAA